MDYKVTDTELTGIANAIRTKGGTQAQLEFPTGFETAIGNISSGGGESTLVTKSITQNGTYSAQDDNADGYSSVTVNVGDASGSDDVPIYMIPNTSDRTLIAKTITGYRTDAKDCAFLYINTDKTKPYISFGSMNSYNKSSQFGPIFTNGKNTLRIKYLPLLLASSSYYTTNIWISDSYAYSNYTPSGTIIGSINLGGNTYTLNYYKNLYGNNFLTDVQDNPDHAAWQVQDINVSNYDYVYIWFRACDMDSMVHSIKLLDVNNS